MLEPRLAPATLVPGPNVNASRLPGNQDESAIAINPTNPLEMFVSSNNGATGMFAARSVDGGLTWLSSNGSDFVVTDGNDNLVTSCCDPTLAWDSFGNLFLGYLQDVNAARASVIAISTNGGLTFAPLVSLNAQTDQPTIAVGPGTGGVGQTLWITYETGGTIRMQGAPITGVGTVGAFSAVFDTGVGQFGDIAVGPNGQVSVIGQTNNQMQVQTDPDGLGPLPLGPVVTFPINVALFDAIPGQPTRTVDAETGLAYDRSGGAFDGRLYMVYTDELVDENNDMDIFLRISDDDGITWSAAQRVNDDPGVNSQFFSKIAVDQTTGDVGIGWVDGRNDAGNVLLETFVAVSDDGGATFTPNLRVSEGPTNGSVAATGGQQLGDYIGLAFESGILAPSWADNSNSTGDNPGGALGQLDIYTASIVVLPEPGIRGLKFHDENGNAVRDMGEPGLPGWTIYIDQNNNGVLDSNEPSAVTDNNGNYFIDTVPLVQQFGLGTYVVREVLQPGWVQTFPTAASTLNVVPPNLATAGNGFYNVTINADDLLISGVNFGNRALPGEIHGVKWFDENGNGVRDGGEAGQPGVTIQLRDEQGALLDQTTTGLFGEYSFEDLMTPQVYLVEEIVPVAQTQTFPGAAAAGQHRIDLQPTQIRIDVDFGNFGQRGSISGRKFHDVDGDGFKDLDELGVADILIYIDLNDDGVLNLGESVVATDQFGYYKISHVVPGRYVVREFVPDGSSQTFPSTGAHTVTVISGQETVNVNFANREVRDWGDAPAPYPTTKAQNGASHGIRPGFFLGNRVDVEEDGQPNATATGDDATGTAFEPGVSYVVGDAPVGALVADLDGERGPDIVTVNENGNNISVLLNNSDGTFADAVNYAVGASPSRVAAGDFNGDGALDLAVSNTGGTNVSILFNRGDGTFMTAVSEPAGQAPRGIAAGDLDDDGDIDLAVANSDEVVSVLLNDGDGAFDPPIEFEVNEGPVWDVVIGDLNRDGNLDLVVANSDTDPNTFSNKISVLLGAGVVSGEPTFGPALDFIVGEEPRQVILADFNRDGFLDAATANEEGVSVSVLLGRGNGTFLPNRDYDVGGAPLSLAAPDLTGDGFRDIVVATQNSGLVPVLINNGFGIFTRGDDLVGGGIGVFVVAADFNGDGGADVAVLNRPTDTVTIIGSAGDDEDGVTFSTLVRGTTGAATVTASEDGILAAWIDFNADGDWNDPGEQIAIDRPLNDGVNQIFFTIPASAVVGNTFARFRFSDQTGLGPAGLASAGEVEDYQVTILATGVGVPGGTYRNPQNPLDVSADGKLTLNDILLLINDLRINGARVLPDPPPAGQEPPPFLDPNGDGSITLNDVLVVINGLLLQNANGEAEGESEEAPLVFLNQPTADAPAGKSRHNNESKTCSAETLVVDSASEEITAPEEGPEDAALFGETEGEDWDDTLETIAGDVSLAWKQFTL
jgi:hypothetical protein